MTEPLTFSSDPVDSNRLYAGTMGLRSIPATRGALGSCVEVRVSVLFIFPQLVVAQRGGGELTAREKRVGIILTVCKLGGIRKSSPVPIADKKRLEGGSSLRAGGRGLAGGMMGKKRRWLGRVLLYREEKFAGRSSKVLEISLARPEYCGAPRERTDHEQRRSSSALATRDLECGTVQPCLAEERRAGAID